MERFHSSGGRSNPDFYYKVSVKEATDEMYHWCSVYDRDTEKCFNRYYVKWGERPVFQFENERPALMFALKFGHL